MFAFFAQSVSNKQLAFIDSYLTFSIYYDYRNFIASNTLTMFHYIIIYALPELDSCLGCS